MCREKLEEKLNSLCKKEGKSIEGLRKEEKNSEGRIEEGKITVNKCKKVKVKISQPDFLWITFCFFSVLESHFFVDIGGRFPRPSPGCWIVVRCSKECVCVSVLQLQHQQQKQYSK